MDLQEQKVVLTGGSSGVGLAMARQLVAWGNQVVICGREAARLEAALGTAPGVSGVVADVSSGEGQAKLVRAAVERMGGISVLIHNAAVQHPYSLVSTELGRLEAWVDEEIGSNLRGVILLTARCLPHLQAERRSAIVTVSSGLALSPKRSAPGYCATKAAVHNFTRALRYQVQRECPNVGVYEVMLPLVNTPMTAGRGATGMRADAAAAAILAGVRAGREENAVGQVKLLRWLHRWSPKLALRVLRDH